MRKPSESSIRAKLLGSALIIIGSFTFFYALHLLFPQVLGAWNNAVNDGFFRIRYALFGREKISPYIVHAVLNDSSIRKLDIPYADRSVYGRILKVLQDASVSAVACDVFIESESSGANDKALIDATSAKKNVYYPVIVFPGGSVTRGKGKPDADDAIAAESKDAIDPVIESNLWRPKVLRKGEAPDAMEALAPFHGIASKARGLGHITCDPDSDGINRRFPLVYKYREGYIPALALRLICDYLQAAPESIQIRFGEYIRLESAGANGRAKKNILIPVDAKGRMIVNFAGPWADSFTHFPAHNLLEAENDKGLALQLNDDIAGSLVIFSNIATRNKDYGPGIFDNVYPASGIHLNIANSILTGNYLSDPGLIESMLGVLFLGLVLLFFASRFKPAGFIIFSVLAYAAFAVLSFAQFVILRELTSPVPPSIAFFSAVVMILFYKLVIEEQEKTLLAERALAAETFEQANLELESANEKLKEIDEYKNRFVQNITHEFRTPLTLILSPLESLANEKDREIDSDSKNLLLLAQRNAKKLLVLINQLLELAKIRSNKMKLRAGFADIHACVKSIVESFGPMAASKGITLAFLSNDKNLSGYIDTEKIERIMFNLLSNAVKFTEAGGTVSVNMEVIKSKSTAEESAENAGTGKLVRILVKDTGAGIPASEMHRIFDRFEQLPNSATGKRIGTGLGLSIAKAFVELHRGSIRVKSEEGDGAEFEVVFPYTIEAYMPGEIDAQVLEPDRRAAAQEIEPGIKLPEQKTTRVHTANTKSKISARILLVEDDAEIRWYIKHVLSDTYIVDEAKNDTEALEKLAQSKPDLVITDVIMSAMDGAKLLKEVRDTKEYQHIPILAITTGDVEQFHTVSNNIMPDDCLCKPFSAEELLVRTANLLRTGSSRHHRESIQKENDHTRESDSLYPQDPVLIVDDDKELLENYKYVFSRQGVTNLVLIEDSRDVLPLLEKKRISCMILDLSIPYISGEEVLSHVSEKYPLIPVIIVTGSDTVENAVRCFKAGAFDYFVKPVDFTRLAISLNHCLEKRELEAELHSMRNKIGGRGLDTPKAFSCIVTASPNMFAVFKKIETYAKSPHPVLITGESGTGKELVAAAIHELSGRSGTFVKVNIAGFDAVMFSDALFGHVKGAYTGADSQRTGLVEEASGGTLFLDEIGDLDPGSQVKLLRLLQEKEYRAQGSDTVKKADARIIVATNADLVKEQGLGAFRPDLYYRLERHCIEVPPLRERLDDIPLLVDHFFKKYAKEAGREAPSVPKELFTLLQTYQFPGNIRELETMVCNALYSHKSKVLSLSYFREYIKEKKRISGTELTGDDDFISRNFSYTGNFPTLDMVEERVIREALKKADHNNRIAAQLLGISPFALSRRLNKAKKSK